MQHHAMRVVPSITTENLTSVERIAMERRWLEAILSCNIAVSLNDQMSESVVTCSHPLPSAPTGAQNPARCPVLASGIDSDDWPGTGTAFPIFHGSLREQRGEDMSYWKTVCLC